MGQKFYNLDTRNNEILEVMCDALSVSLVI